MIVLLTRSNIEEAISLAEVTYAKWKNRSGHYPNLYNSHVKGKIGEIAVEGWLKTHGVPCLPRFRNPREQSLCDIETTTSNKHLRLEIKTWSSEHWPDQGRCIKVEQLAKLQGTVDAVVWCVVDLPPVKSATDLAPINFLRVELRGWSTVAEVTETEPRLTGWRKINNHQVGQDALRPMETLLGSA